MRMGMNIMSVTRHSSWILGTGSVTSGSPQMACCAVIRSVICGIRVGLLRVGSNYRGKPTICNWGITVGLLRAGANHCGHRENKCAAILHTRFF